MISQILGVKRGRARRGEVESVFGACWDKDRRLALALGGVWRLKKKKKKRASISICFRDCSLHRGTVTTALDWAAGRKVGCMKMPFQHGLVGVRSKYFSF